MENTMKYYYLDNFTYELVDEGLMDWEYAPPERYTLICTFEGEEFNDTFSEVWITSEGIEKIRYLNIEKYHIDVHEEREKKLKGRPLYLKEVVIPDAYFKRWLQ